mgnify:CR=1 FL=1
MILTFNRLRVIINSLKERNDMAIKQIMTLEEILEHIEKTLTINFDELGRESVRQVHIFSELQKLHMWNTRRLESLMIQQNQVKMARIRHYTGKMPAEHYKTDPLREAVLKTDLDIYMKIDKQVLEMSGLVNEQERIVKAIEEAKATLRDRGYNIKNAIEFQRMITLGT